MQTNACCTQCMHYLHACHNTNKSCDARHQSFHTNQTKYVPCRCHGPCCRDTHESCHVCMHACMIMSLNHLMWCHMWMRNMHRHMCNACHTCHDIHYMYACNANMSHEHPHDMIQCIHTTCMPWQTMHHTICMVICMQCMSWQCACKYACMHMTCISMHGMCMHMFMTWHACICACKYALTYTCICMHAYVCNCCACHTCHAHAIIQCIHMTCMWFVVHGHGIRYMVCMVLQMCGIPCLTHAWYANSTDECVESCCMHAPIYMNA